jgi:putative transposase
VERKEERREASEKPPCVPPCTSPLNPPHTITLSFIMPILRIKKDDENSLHFLTLVVLDHVEVFIKDKYFDVILNCLRYCQKNLGLLLYEFVIMKDHLHLIIAAQKGYELSKIVSSFKKFTTGEMLKLLKQDDFLIYQLILDSERKKQRNDSQFWRQGNWPKLIVSPEFLDQKINYIHDNPVRKGYVVNQEDWKYSSARNRILGDSSLIEVLKYVF